ncbi:MAG: SHOCT domain-containing protein [Flavobacteriales bacterium]|nr:SHOCT domain-containing protein [Flavobacteriales bacterium]
MVENIRARLAVPDSVQRAKDWFYTNLRVNACFFETATELAGQRWFEAYLRDKAVQWTLPFDDVKANTVEGYKYTEHYSGDISNTALDPNADVTKALPDRQVHELGQERREQQGPEAYLVSGYFRSLTFSNDQFLITITDALNDPLPKTSAQATESKGGSALENADKLKKLKELLDAGILTKAEYDAEKKKLLGTPDHILSIPPRDPPARTALLRRRPGLSVPGLR